jgi:hypothetical protein
MGCSAPTAGRLARPAGIRLFRASGTARAAGGTGGLRPSSAIGVRSELQRMVNSCNEARSCHTSFQPAKRGRMKTARRFLSATALGCMVVFFMFMFGCASTRAVVEPPAETASPPVVDPALGPPTGPPPGHVEPTNYWVREKIVLTSEPAPPVSATPKSSVKKGKKSKKTG